MLTLNDGRNELWQWDTGRKLSVDADCSQVHFSNKVFGRSIDVDVVDGVAIIPDILLQTDKALMAWAFVGTPENGYTKISRLFNVNKRNKPADYMFTPPDQTTLGEILDRIKDLENRPSGGQVETDPTLSMPGSPADAKAVGDALEDKANQELVDEVVGILSEHENVHDILQQQINDKAGKNEIPKALPNPSKLTIDGESYDGSVAVDFTSTINGMIDEKMGTGQGGGKWEIISEHTIDGVVSADIPCNFDDYKKVMIIFNGFGTTPNEGKINAHFMYADTDTTQQMVQTIITTNDKRFGYIVVDTELGEIRYPAALSWAHASKNLFTIPDAPAQRYFEGAIGIRFLCIDSSGGGTNVSTTNTMGGNIIIKGIRA